MTDQTEAPHRVAIYAAPAQGTPWCERGSTWLGRCATTLKPLPQPPIEGLDTHTQAGLTAEPRRYGWHATMKAPMRLSPSADWAALQRGVEALCKEYRPIELGALHVCRLDNFLALMPRQPPAALSALADDCVRRLRPLAAELSPEELARRRRANLSAEEDALLLAWGYPWVLQKFRFHFTLTGPLDGTSSDTIERLEKAAREHFSALPPLRLEHLSIFTEQTAGADFLLRDQVALSA